MIFRLLAAALFCACLVAPAKAETRFIPHPAGCPRVAFCACGASVEAFGKPIRELFLAINWKRKFPRAEAAPGMAAVRPGHVFILRRHIEGLVWEVVDHNSGGRRSRIHHRSIAGFTIVDPHGGRQGHVLAAAEPQW